MVRGTPRLGTDLRGGMEILLEVQAEDVMAEKVASDVRALRLALRRRVPELHGLSSSAFFACSARHPAAGPRLRRASPGSA